jgi:hypothetical protein
LPISVILQSAALLFCIIKAAPYPFIPITQDVSVLRSFKKRGGGYQITESRKKRPENLKSYFAFLNFEHFVKQRERIFVNQRNNKRRKKTYQSDYRKNYERIYEICRQILRNHYLFIYKII